MTSNLRQGNKGKQLAQSCYAMMSGTAARDGSWTRHVLVSFCSLDERANDYTTAPHFYFHISRPSGRASKKLVIYRPKITGWVQITHSHFET